MKLSVVIFTGPIPDWLAWPLLLILLVVAVPLIRLIHSILKEAGRK